MADDTNFWDDIFTTNIDDYTYDADDYSVDNYDPMGYDSWDTDLWGGSDQYDDFGLADLFDNYNFDDTFSADDFDMDSNWWDDTDWWGDSFDDEGTYNYDPMADLYGNTDLSPEGQIGSWMDDYFSSGASTENIDYKNMPWFDSYISHLDEKGPLGGTFGPKARDFFAELFGFAGGGGGKKTGGGIMDLLSSLAGGTKNMLDNDLVKMLLAKKLLDDDRDGGSAGYVPIGQEAYGGGSPLPDYRISNIQPALLPGMAYANQPTTFNNMPPPTAPPPGMQAGGLAHHHPQLHSHTQAPQGPQPLPYIPGQPGSRALPMPYKPDGMQAGGIASLENRMEGPGDVTQAMLEPGEFVMTRKATQNLTPEYLYSLMHQAENAGRMR